MHIIPLPFMQIDVCQTYVKYIFKINFTNSSDILLIILKKQNRISICFFYRNFVNGILLIKTNIYSLIRF